MRNEYTSRYLEQRKKQLIEDNVIEDRIIKKLNRKLGLNRRKPRKSGINKHPAWMRDSGLDYLLDFVNRNECSVKTELKAGVLGESNVKAKSKTENIYGQNVDESDQSRSCLENMDDLEDDDDLISDSKIERIADYNELEEGCIVEPKKDVIKGSSVASDAIGRSHNSSSVDDDIISLRRSIRRLLNCVSESQMVKTISGLAELFSDRPLATVSRILIEEIDILLESFPLNRGQSKGWLQQELAACFVSTQARLDHGGQDSRLVAHFAEFFVSSKLPTKFSLASSDAGGALASRCLFVSYLYRFGALTGDLIMDCVEEFIKAGDLLGFQITNQILKPISSMLRKELFDRCNQLIHSVKEILIALDSSEFEKVSELEGIVANLSAKYSKEPALLSACHFAKMIRKWNKGFSFPTDSRLPLRLEELRNSKSDGKGRWWAVGSAFSGEAFRSEFVSGTCTLPKRDVSSNKSLLSPELALVATRLGLIAPIRQQLFSILVSTPGGPESTADALVKAARAGGAGVGRSTDHREREMVQIIKHCLISEQPFNRFYPRVLGALLNHHRRFTIKVRCAFWDVMATDGLSKEAKINAGKAIGILVAVYDFPLIIIKKFNFGDNSEANVAFLSALITELTSMAFKKTLEKFAYVASNFPKLGRNLRIFMRRLSKSHPDEACQSYLSKLVSELRDLFP